MAKRYMVYGKRPSDSKFAPLNARGCRVSKADAELFDSKEEAQAFTEKYPLKPGCKIDIRVAKV